jgi:hypothetical protein
MFLVVQTSKLVYVWTKAYCENWKCICSVWKKSFQDTSQVYQNKPFHLVRSPFSCKVADITEIVQEKFIEILNSTAIKSELFSFLET